ncbi:MAG: hypothetical protein ACTHOE_14205 [Conexibacter sp.]
MTLTRYFTKVPDAPVCSFPDVLNQASFASAELPGHPFAPQECGVPLGIDGCDAVPFDPTPDAQPTDDTKAGSPAAFAFDLNIPQDDTPGSIAQSDLRKAVVTLPLGVHVNPSSADGLDACSPAQIALASDALPTCPDSSKLGTVTIDTPLLDDPVTGDIYLATPFDNPFNSLVAVYIVASAQGVMIKLPGEAALDSDTGQITTTFDDNPQLPFSRPHLKLKSGPRAPLALTHRCGTYTTHAELTGWNGRTVVSDSSFTLSENAKGHPCPAQFSPGFSAGTESNGACRSSSFLTHFTRDDEDQELCTVTVYVLRCLTGKIASAEECSDSQASGAAYPAGSKIGDVTVGAGAGSNPFYITNGNAYLTGPYKGAPFGVAIVVPAVAGPFDLGTVIVRAAVFVDKYDATVRFVSDPFPTFLQGIPLNARDVRVHVDKPGVLAQPDQLPNADLHGRLRRGRQPTCSTASRRLTAHAASQGEPAVRAGDAAEDDQRAVERDQTTRARAPSSRATSESAGTRRRHAGGFHAAAARSAQGQCLLRQERARDPGSVRGAARSGRLRPRRADHDPRDEQGRPLSLSA